MRLLNNDNRMVIGCTLLFLVDLVSIFADYVPISVSKVLLYLTSWGLFYKATKRSGTGKCQKTRFFWSMVALYFVLLFLRLCVDFVLPWKGFFMYKSPYTIMFFFFMSMVMPCYFIRRATSELDYMKFSVCSGIMLCLYLLFSYNEIVLGMVVAENTGGQYAGVGGIDIITYGHLGLSLILIAVYMTLYSNKKYLFVYILFIFAGLSAMVLSGARSPFVALGLCLLVLLRSKYSKWYYLIGGLLLVVYFAKFFQSEIIQFNEYLKSIGIGSLERVVNTFWGDSHSIDEISSGRDKIYIAGWNIFLKNPLTGVSYLLPDNSYVHNIFLEQFMALGFIGGILFIIINIKVLIWGWRTVAVSRRSVLTYILFMQYMILGCFSRTIIALGAYWLFMFITVRNYERIKQQYICHNSNL